MSGGYFDYKQSAMKYIADTIEHDIALALQPKPEKVHDDYWTIYEQTSVQSYRPFHSYCHFETYKEAESFLIRDTSVIKADDMFRARCLCNKDDVMFQSTERMLEATDGTLIPVLYWIHHCVYDHYPYDADILELSEVSLEIMKDAYKQIRIAQIYAQRVDWMMSGDDSEETMQQRLEENLKDFEEEFKNKNWKG